MAASTLSLLLASCATSGGGHVGPVRTPEQVALVAFTERAVTQAVATHPDNDLVSHEYWSAVEKVLARQPAALFDVQVLSLQLDAVTAPYRSGEPNPYKDAVLDITARCWAYANGPVPVLVNTTRLDGPALAAEGVRNGLKRSGL